MGALKMDKKPGMLLAIGIKPTKMKPGSDMHDSMHDSADEADAHEEHESEDFNASADSAFDALKEDDRAGFKLALKAAMMACHPPEPTGSEPDMADEEEEQ